MVEVGWDVDLDIGVEWSVISMVGVMFEVMFTTWAGPMGFLSKYIGFGAYPIGCGE